MTDTTITYAGVSSATIAGLYVENVSRDITPGIRDVYVDVPGRAGSWHFPEEGADRGLSVEFAVVGDTLELRRSALREVGRWLYRRGRAKLIISDEPDRFVEASLASAISAEERLTLARFSAEFRTSPYAYSVAIDTDTVVGTDTVTVTPSDDLADEMFPSVEVTAAGALPSGFTLTVAGRELVYGSAVSAAGKVTISAVSSTVTTGADTDTDLDGTFDVADLRMTAVSGQFPRLYSGANTVTVTGGATAVLRWRRRYV